MWHVGSRLKTPVLSHGSIDDADDDDFYFWEIYKTDR
jgi:hypothetical protein